MFSRPTVATVILAAGEGSRFGGSKLTAPFQGRVLAQHAIDAACASQATACFLVIGAHADALRTQVDPRRCAIVPNRTWREGIASSIRTGVACATNFDACLFMLADQPYVTSADLDSLIAHVERHPMTIAALRVANIWGAPVAFPHRDFAALRKLRGDAGAKSYAASNGDRLQFVPAIDPRAFYDVDTKLDLRRLNDFKSVRRA